MYLVPSVREPDRLRNTVKRHGTLAHQLYAVVRLAALDQAVTPTAVHEIPESKGNL